MRGAPCGRIRWNIKLYLRDAPPRTQGYFSLLVQRKVTKRKHPPGWREHGLRFSAMGPPLPDATSLSRRGVAALLAATLRALPIALRCSPCATRGKVLPLSPSDVVGGFCFYAVGTKRERTKAK